MMDWSASTLWWLATAALVAAELATGTFYLLMLALGGAAAALAAHAGLGFSLQLVAAAVVGGGAVTLWHWRRERPGSAPEPERNRDLLLDIGSTVQVEQWQGDGRTTVSYRGAGWQARHGGSGPPHPGLHRISAIDGNCLVLEPTH